MLGTAVHDSKARHNSLVQATRNSSRRPVVYRSVYPFAASRACGSEEYLVISSSNSDADSTLVFHNHVIKIPSKVGQNEDIPEVPGFGHIL